jgi:CubicO group peptidase (beta-lactamase class C family)
LAFTNFCVDRLLNQDGNVPFPTCIVALILLITGASVGSAEDTKPLAERVADLTASYRAKRPAGALAVGIIQKDKSESFGFGEITHDGQATPVDGRTMFEIGSCTKVFTSLSLAVVVSRGDATLDDPISKLLPDAVLSPDAAKITLRELSTHTSGLPRLPTAMFFDALIWSGNPYQRFTDERLLDVLKSWEAPAKKKFAYSNMGAGVLGYVLQQKEHVQTYGELIRSTVTEPLGLKDTVVTLSDDQKTRHAVGHDPDGAEVASWDFVSLAGAGALRSSADDLLRFLNIEMHPETSSLEDAIELSQQKQYEGEHGALGLGWMLVEKDGLKLAWHNGATGGYRTFCSFNRTSGVGVVLLSSTGDAAGPEGGAIDTMGFELLTMVQESTRSP